jgi:GntR family transcriptional regulator/MocR family aminotransferase
MLYININRGNKLSLSRQIYCSIKENVLHGKIPAGTKLPSSRELSAELHVARNVVIESYEQLIAEGYAFSKKGSGTYINEGVFLPVPEREICLHKSTTVSSEPSVSVSFRTGIPDLSQIPIKKWGQIYHKTVLDVKPHQLDYQNPIGDNSLRLTLERYYIVYGELKSTRKIFFLQTVQLSPLTCYVSLSYHMNMRLWKTR